MAFNMTLLKVSQTPVDGILWIWWVDSTATGSPTWLPSSLTWLENDQVIDDDISYIYIYLFIYIPHIYIDIDIDKDIDIDISHNII